MGIRRHKVLFDATAAATGDWVRLDSRYEVDPVRPLQIVVSGGDSLALQATTLDIRGEADPTVGISSDDIITLKTYTAGEDDVLVGNWTYIRVVKTGSNAPSKVQGHL